MTTVDHRANAVKSKYNIVTNENIQGVTVIAARNCGKGEEVEAEAGVGGVCRRIEMYEKDSTLA
jgi:hypothetical protein